ncbi:ATP-binding protein [Rhizobiaceae bacterium BDR2-2]|uniref:histidine kinase n=1 Tax=Ectorhizobium quercum TaxID=2965071 RepID=A0AAE3N1F2_9HYPH|nr:ATP-binding protein [Ectorhizobium quercum]MCX8998146.1 ATP-binding protein [Ectorhizobium quercum]
MTSSPLYRLTGFVIIGFIVLFGYSFQQLMQFQYAVRMEIGENMLWSLTQAEREARKLGDAVLELAYEGGSVDVLSERLDILHSRITLLNEGPQRTYFTRIGLWPALERNTRALEEVNVLVEQAVETGRIEPHGVRTILMPMMDDFGRLANRAMLVEREEAGERRDQQSSALNLVIMAVAGLMLTGSFLIWRLIVNTRTAISSGAALAEHKVRLEAMVEERTAALSSALEKEKNISEIYRSFITTVSHQFRTPLSIIDMVAQSFIRRPGAFPPEAVAEKAQRIRNACLRLMRMLESTTNAARLDGGAVPVDLTDNDLGHIVESACAYQRELQPERHILLSFEDGDFPCRADAALIEQVLLNLLSNATKYSPEDTEVRVRVFANAGHVFCSVADRGIGIPEEDREKIFTRFFRAGNAANIPGTGLGLNLSRAIAVLHGGMLEFRPVEGGGTEFILTLPRRGER